MSVNSNLLGAKDIVFMNVIGILSLRQIPNVAPYGASAMILWIVAAFCFFIPLAMVCGELSTGWPKDGGIFVWITEAFGKKVGWVATVCYLFSCVIFFPMMLQFAFAAAAYLMPQELTSDAMFMKYFIGIGSIIMFCALTFLNILGMKWTKIINSVSAYCGIFIPTALIIILAIVWLATGHEMQSKYEFTAANYMPNLGDWNTIVFASSMMFAFAGLEISGMVAGRTKNPQKDFPKAMLYSAICIVGIYMVGTWALNTIYPSDKTDIVEGITQAIGFAGNALGIPWLLQIIAICLFVGVVGQVNSWLVGPIYMLQEASREDKILGEGISQLHPKYQTPHKALIYQAVIVCVLCLSTFLSESIAEAYWFLTALTTICYFIPYLIMFPAFIYLRKIKPDVHRAFKIPGKILPIIFPILGFLSIAFAVFLIFIPPAELSSADATFMDKFWYFFKIFLGGAIAVGTALITYSMALKRNATSKGE